MLFFHRRYSANVSQAIFNMNMNMTVKCAFCGASSSSTCCQSCSAASRVEKFSRLLSRFGAASDSISYYDDIIALDRKQLAGNEENHIHNYFADYFYLVFCIGGIASFCTGSVIRRNSSSIGSRRPDIFEKGQ